MGRASPRVGGGVVQPATSSSTSAFGAKKVAAVVLFACLLRAHSRFNVVRKVVSPPGRRSRFVWPGTVVSKQRVRLQCGVDKFSRNGRAIRANALVASASVAMGPDALQRAAQHPVTEAARGAVQQWLHPPAQQLEWNFIKVMMMQLHLVLGGPIAVDT